MASLVFTAGGLGHVAGGLWPTLASPAPTSLACPHWPSLPLPASTAPTSLACPHRPRLPPCQEGGLCTGSRHWAPALAVGIQFSFSLFHISVDSFPFSLDRQTIHHLLFSPLIFSCQQVMSPALS